jgi:hypothetical protein
MVFTSKQIYGIVSILLGFFALRCRSAQYTSVPPSASYYGQDEPWGPVTVNYGSFPGSGSSGEGEILRGTHSL